MPAAPASRVRHCRVCIDVLLLRTGLLLLDVAAQQARQRLPLGAARRQPIGGERPLERLSRQKT